jgi:hypothetical protein
MGADIRFRIIKITEFPEGAMHMGLNDSYLRRNWRRMAALITVVVAVQAPARIGSADDAANRIVTRSVVSPGDTSRLEHVLARARRAGPVSPLSNIEGKRTGK